MTRFLRGYLGALFSALLVLFVHPQSRPYMSLVFTQAGENAVFNETKWIPGNQPVLPQPDDKITEGLWMVVGADRLTTAPTAGRGDLEKLLQLTRRASEEDPTNAYWMQSSAVILRALGRKAEALDQWLRASRCRKWSDYQAERLLAVASELEKSCGMKSSWQVLSLYPYRVRQHAKMTERYARGLSSEYDFSDAPSLAIRYATLVNGRLMRDGAGSFEVQLVGQDITEIASYPKHIEIDPTQKALWIARFNLIDGLKKWSMTDQAADAFKTFQDNDGWSYQIGTAGADEHVRLLTLASVLTVSGPSALLAIALSASLIWACGGLMLRKPILQTAFKTPVAPLIGMAAGIAIYATLHLAIVAVAATAAFGFVAFAPGQERAKPSEDLGPFFRFALVMISLALTLLLGGLFIGLSAPGVHLLPAVGVTSEYVGGSGTLIGLAAMALGLLLLVAPAWALVRKVPTSWVLALGARDLGKGLFLGAASLSVLCALATVYFDSRLYEQGRRLLENEPIYYYGE